VNNQQETNTTPLSMTPKELSLASADLARRADATQPYSLERAQLLDELGKLWVSQGYVVIGQTWHDAAEYCRSRGQG
jgi:hypothetical protein